jgi:hypothetical protein
LRAVISAAISLIGRLAQRAALFPMIRLKFTTGTGQESGGRRQKSEGRISGWLFSEAPEDEPRNHTNQTNFQSSHQQSAEFRISRRYATLRRARAEFPALKRRAKIHRRYASNSKLDALFRFIYGSTLCCFV